MSSDQTLFTEFRIDCVSRLFSIVVSFNSSLDFRSIFFSLRLREKKKIEKRVWDDVMLLCTKEEGKETLLNIIKLRIEC